MVAWKTTLFIHPKYGVINVNLGQMPRQVPRQMPRQMPRHRAEGGHPITLVVWHYYVDQRVLLAKLWSVNCQIFHMYHHIL